MIRCAVVGAGIVGLAVARELQACGATVVVLERSGVGAGASGVQPGGVRQQWGTRVACRLARESVAFWRQADTVDPLDRRENACALPWHVGPRLVPGAVRVDASQGSFEAEDRLTTGVS